MNSLFDLNFGIFSSLIICSIHIISFYFLFFYLILFQSLIKSLINFKLLFVLFSFFNSVLFFSCFRKWRPVLFWCNFIPKDSERKLVFSILFRVRGRMQKEERREQDKEEGNGLFWSNNK